MDLSVHTTSPSLPFPHHSSLMFNSCGHPMLHLGYRSLSWKPLIWLQNDAIRAQSFNQTPNDGFVLEDVPHLTHCLDLQANFCQPRRRGCPEGNLNWFNQKYTPGGVHFHLAGPREKDPTYMIRVIPSNASDNIYCTLIVLCMVPWLVTLASRLGQ